MPGIRQTAKKETTTNNNNNGNWEKSAPEDLCFANIVIPITLKDKNGREFTYNFTGSVSCIDNENTDAKTLKRNALARRLHNKEYQATAKFYYGKSAAEQDSLEDCEII